MANNFTSLEKWRAYFRTSDSDIFSIIEYAVVVAASDCPYEFKLKRDHIAELLFSCKSTKCSGCDKIQLGFDDDSNRSEEKCNKSVIDTKESKMNSFSTDDEVMVNNNVNRISYGEAEALTDELEEEYQFHEEVLRIKQIIDNYEEESDSLLFDSLRKLQLMPMNVEILKSTEIGKSVNAARKHGSKDIRSLSRTLIENWKVMVDSWVSIMPTITAEVATESVKTSTVEDDEVGLPSPPMDEGAFFATPISMELSQFFDGMDDDGIPLESSRKPSFVRKVPKTGTESKPWINESRPDRPKTIVKQHKVINGIIPQRDHEKNGRIPKPSPVFEVENRNKDDNVTSSVGFKLEVAKRKLHERYQEAENAKKRRRIQVVESHDLPKQSGVQRKRQWR